MKWQAVLAGALASALVTCAASADVRIVSDPGGEVSSYIQKFHAVRDSGERVVIDGPCLSACTLLTGIIPQNRICVTQPRRAGLPCSVVLRRRVAVAGADAPRQPLGDAALPAGNPVLDQSAWRAHPAAHNAARPGAVRALSHLSVSRARRGGSRRTDAVVASRVPAYLRRRNLSHIRLSHVR